MKKIILFLFLFAYMMYADPCLAQSPAPAGLPPVMDAVAAHHPALRALREEARASLLENLSGSSTPAPELSYAYQWGSPSAIGKRTNIEVSQSFPFPTVYARRNRLLDAQGLALSWEYIEGRTRLLLEAEQLCIDLVHANAREALLRRQVEDARRLAQAYEAALGAGETDRPSANQARLYQVQAEQAWEALCLDRASLLRQLEARAGGPVQLADTLWPLPPLPLDFDTWYARVEASHPALQHAAAEVDARGGEVKLRRAEGLPRISAGYVREQVVGERFEGVQVGLSLPLWENKKRVKAAQSALRAAEYAQDQVRQAWRTAYQDLYARAQALDRMAGEGQAAAESCGNLELLDKALRAGQLSLADYLQGREAYYRALDLALENRRQRDRCLAALWAWSRYGTEASDAEIL